MQRISKTCSLAFLVSLMLQSWSVSAWTTTNNHHVQPKITTPDRRQWLSQVSGAVLSGAVLIQNSSPANAAAVPTPKDLTKLQRGHARVRYLLENWDSITSICGKGVMTDMERKQIVRTEGGGGGFCERSPLNVQEYLGYKSTEDPLFKADKLMFKAAELVDQDVLEDYLDIVEQYREKADQGSMMAYTSSWGEANPNGGKELIDEYLERTQEEVVKTEVLLRDVLKYLNLEVLPPSKSMK